MEIIVKFSTDSTAADNGNLDGYTKDKMIVDIENDQQIDKKN